MTVRLPLFNSANLTVWSKPRRSFFMRPRNLGPWGVWRCRDCGLWGWADTPRAAYDAAAFHHMEAHGSEWSEHYDTDDDGSLGSSHHPGHDPELDDVL